MASLREAESLDSRLRGNDEAIRRSAARRTALIVGATAVAVYVGFLILAAVGGK